MHIDRTVKTAARSAAKGLICWGLGLFCGIDVCFGQTINGPQLVQSGLMAEYRLTEGSGTSITDFSGNGNTGTFGTGNAAPTWVPNTGGLKFTIGPSGGQFVNLPVALNGAVTIQLYISFQGNGSGDTDNTRFYAPIMGSSFPDCGGLLLTNSTSGVLPALQGGFRIWSFGKNAFHSVSTFEDRSREVFYGNGAIALVRDASLGKDVLYENDQDQGLIDLYYSGLSAAPTLGNYRLGGTPSNNCTPFATWFPGVVYYAVFYNRVLQPGEIAQNAAFLRAILASRGVSTPNLLPLPADTLDQLVLDGDSITFGYNGTSANPAAGISGQVHFRLTTPWSSSLVLNPPPGGRWFVSNQGLYGMQLGDMLTDAPLSIDTMFRPNAARNVVVTWGGTNDLANSVSTPDQVFSVLRTYCLARRALGWKVIVVTMISRSGTGTGGVTNDSLKNAYNDLIRQNWQTFADGLADVAASRLGQDGDYLTADFIDGVHPSQGSATNIIAPIISQAINHLP